MMWWELEGVGHTPEPKPDPPAEPNPDQERSHSAYHIEERVDDVVCVMQVKGLGAIMMRATFEDEGDKLVFNGLSIYTDAEIGLWS